MSRSIWLAAVSCAAAAGGLVGCSSGRTYSAPATFTVTDEAVAKLAQQAVDADSAATKLDGPASANCDSQKTCTISYTIEEPIGGASSKADTEMIEPTRQIWKALFADPTFQSGTITVSGPVISIGGKPATDVYYSLTCDRRAAGRIDWDKVDGEGLRALCAYSPKIKGMPGAPAS
jgi:hypothetical protein